jgi:glucose/mannose-6-phosphate isomerase
VNTPHGGVALAAFRLDDPELVESGDPGGMLRQVASSAAQVRTAVRACDETDLSALRPESRPRAIVVAGAGGSVFAGETLAAICGPRAPVQVIGVSGYQLPGWVGAADLVIAVSRSGETAEVLALAAEAARRGCDLAAVAAPGSPLQQVALAARGTFIPVTSGGQPAPARSMPWALAVPLLVMASRLGVARVDAAAYESAAAAMEDISHQCRPSSESFVNPAKSLALDLVGTLPLIWGGSPLANVAARRFASQLAANAKYPSLAGALPDAGHDQVATFDGPFAPAPEPDFPAAEDFGDDSFDELSPADVSALTGTSDGNPLLRLVLLADRAGEPSAVIRSREAAVSLAGARGIEVSEIAMDGTEPLVRLAGAIHLLDYASVYLGIACGIDPLAIAAIKDLRDLTEPPV